MMHKDLITWIILWMPCKGKNQPDALEWGNRVIYSKFLGAEKVALGSLRKGNYLLGGYEVDRLQDNNLWETFLEQLNTKLEKLNFDIVEDCWNNFGK